jgi:hypothetical protein
MTRSPWRPRHPLFSGCNLSSYVCHDERSEASAPPLRLSSLTPPFRRREGSAFRQPSEKSVVVITNEVRHLLFLRAAMMRAPHPRPARRRKKAPHLQVWVAMQIDSKVPSATTHFRRLPVRRGRRAPLLRLPGSQVLRAIPTLGSVGSRGAPANSHCCVRVPRSIEA